MWFYAAKQYTFKNVLYFQSTYIYITSNNFLLFYFHSTGTHFSLPPFCGKRRWHQQKVSENKLEAANKRLFKDFEIWINNFAMIALTKVYRDAKTLVSILPSFLTSIQPSIFICIHFIQRFLLQHY